MKFAVSSIFLLALLLGGSYWAYEAGSHKEEPAEGTLVGEAGGTLDAGNIEAAGEVEELTEPLANVLPTEQDRNDADGIIRQGEALAEAGAPEADVVHGKLLYDTNCAGCHGVGGGGGVGPAMIGADNAANWEFAAFRNVFIRYVQPDGTTLEPPMPRYDQTPLLPDGELATEQDIADIQGYLQTLE